MPGRKISQTPVSTRLRIEWRRPSHSLNSPTTETRRARGAHTAKWTPADALMLERAGAELVPQAKMRPFGMEVVVERAEQWAEAIGILERPGAAGVATPRGDRRGRVPRHGPLEHAVWVARGQGGERLAIVGYDADLVRMGYEGTNDPSLAGRMGPEHAERVRVTPRGDRRDVGFRQTGRLRRAATGRRILARLAGKLGQTLIPPASPAAKKRRSSQ